jgi:hypothetical protein
LDISIIILIIIGAIVLSFASKFLGATLKILVKLGLIIIIALALLTVLVIKDMNELRTSFGEQNNTFLLYENGKLYTALTLKPVKNPVLSTDSFIYFTKNQTKTLDKQISNGEYENIMLKTNKLLFISPEVLDKPFSLKLGVELNPDDLLGVIKSDDPFMFLADKIHLSYNLTADILRSSLTSIYGDEGQIKGYLFAALLGNYLQKQEPGELVKNLKEGKIRIYPETITFKLIKYMPWV